LLAAVPCLWIHRVAWMTALGIAVAAGYLSGALRGPAMVWITIAAALCWWYARSRDRARIGRGRAQQAIAGVVLFVYGLAMALPLLPGFVRIELVPAQVLTEGAAPYALAVGFPKVTLGVLLLGLVNPSLLSPQRLGLVLTRAAPVLAVTLLLVIASALALGYTRFAPHWHALFLWWAPINLLFTCLSEEAFFRGFVQQELAGGGEAAGAYRNSLALIASALLFGLAHYAGGVSYVFAGTIAGLGYGWAFLRTRRIEAPIAVHFGVNAAHFLLFVYPRPA
jgi:membrane protease YdiL (CAAX protease family)